MLALAGTIVGLLADVLKLGALFFRDSGAIRAENLVLRRQLARYLERGIKPPTDGSRDSRLPFGVLQILQLA